MRYKKQGSYHSVKVSEREVREFNDNWPCANLPERACYFVFEANGDIVDMSHHLVTEFNGDPGALSALCDDAKMFAKL